MTEGSAIPAASCHEGPKYNATGGLARHSFFVYGGVSLQPRINVVPGNGSPLGGNATGSVALGALPTGSGVASNIVNRDRLQTELALKQANILNEQGQLTQAAIRQSSSALNQAISNPSVIRALESSGSHINEWGKYATPSVEIFTGQRVQVHYYKNNATGEVNYAHDFKVKGEVNIFHRKAQPESGVLPYKRS